MCIAQQSSTFVEKYTSVSSKENHVVQPWKETDLTVVFNSNGTTNIVFYYGNGKIITFYRIGSVEKGVTKGGQEYQLVYCIDEDGVEVVMQLFEDNACLRVVIGDGYTIEFHKD